MFLIKFKDFLCKYVLYALGFKRVRGREKWLKCHPHVAVSTAKTKDSNFKCYEKLLGG